MKSARAMSADSISIELLELSTRYRDLLPRPHPAVRELPGHFLPDFTERHLQCIWYDPSLRPASLTDRDGEPVQVEDPGDWNLEPGPDFRHARVRAGGRLVAGDVEVHVHPADWKHHHHGDDPRYQWVRIHVTYFPGRRQDACFRPGVLHIPLAESLRSSPGFSFDAIDVTAYPFSACRQPPPCAPHLQAKGLDFCIAFLEAAGAERIRRKSQRLRSRAHQAGISQALYEEIMAALGYRHNKQAFRQLASLAPLGLMRERCEDSPLMWYAVFMGISGLLPENAPQGWPESSRRFVRSLWDIWWRQAGAWQHSAMQRSAWVTAGVRPANHPIRRLEAAAWFFSREDVIEVFKQAYAAGSEAVRLLFRKLNPEKSFWRRRLAWAGRIQPRSIALVGKDRIRAIAANVLWPAAHAFGWAGDDFELRTAVPAETLNSIMRRTAHLLFGRDHPAAIYRSGLARQGLMQVAADFCFRDNSRCKSCPLPGALAGRAGDE